MVRIAFFPLCVGSPVTRSIATRWNGRALCSVGMRYRGIFRLCVRFLACWQIAQPFTYSAIHWFILSLGRCRAVLIRHLVVYLLFLGCVGLRSRILGGPRASELSFG